PRACPGSWGGQTPRPAFRPAGLEGAGGVRGGKNRDRAGRPAAPSRPAAHRRAGEDRGPAPGAPMTSPSRQPASNLRRQPSATRPQSEPTIMPELTTFAFSDADRAATYRAILTRRDVRSQFRPDPVPDDVLLRILTAAHHAPSVGFSQPWDFVVIDRTDVREAVKAMFDRENARAAANYTGERRRARP